MSIQNLKQPSFKSERRFIFFQATLKQKRRAYRQSQKQAKANSLHSQFQFCLCEVLTLPQAPLTVPDLTFVLFGSRQHSSRILRNHHNNYCSQNLTVYILWYLPYNNNYLLHILWYIIRYILLLIHFKKIYKNALLLLTKCDKCSIIMLKNYR